MKVLTSKKNKNKTNLADPSFLNASAIPQMLVKYDKIFLC